MVREELYAAHTRGLARIPRGADAHLPRGLLLDLDAGEGQAALWVENVLGAAVQLGAKAEAHEFEALHQLARPGASAAARAARRAGGLAARATCRAAPARIVLARTGLVRTAAASAWLALAPAIALAARGPLAAIPPVPGVGEAAVFVQPPPAFRVVIAGL